MNIKQLNKAGRAGLTAAALLAMGSTAALGAESGTTYAFGGYVKFDAMFSDYSAGTPASSSILRQFYIPSALAIGDTGNSDYTADFQARESRINFRSDTVLDNGDKLGTYIEMDFFTHSDGNELVSNSYSPRIRHAFLKYNGWLFGQTWSTFQDVGALPENLDFVGPAEGTTFVRQGQIRYTTGAWEFAAENPETFYLSGGARTSAGDDLLPDLVARYTFKLGSGGYIKVAGLFRQLNVQTTTMDDSATAFAVSASGKHMFGKHDLRWMYTYGDGVGRYLALALGTDAVEVVNPSTGGPANTLETITESGAFISFRAVWSDKMRSNFTVGAYMADNDVNLTGTGVTKSAASAHVNLIWTLAPKLDVGVELMTAQRELESGLDGDMTRLMFSAKYAF
jgi:hypothetical protein